jgi:hypothetical protein
VATVLFGDAGQRGSGSAAVSAAATGDAAAAGMSGGGGEQGAAVAVVRGSWQSLPGSPHASDRRSSSLLPSLQQMQQQRPVAAAATAATEPSVDAAPAASAAPGAPPLAPAHLPPPSGRTISQEELAAEQSGDWQVLFHEQQLDCQLALEDPSPGMPWGRAKFQASIVAYSNSICCALLMALAQCWLSATGK